MINASPMMKTMCAWMDGGEGGREGCVCVCVTDGADLEVVHCLGRPPCLVQLLDDDSVEGMRRLSPHVLLMGEAKDAPCGPGSQRWGCCCCCC
jgi:hypothetical protein